ncbi:MAG: hypothetical protein K0B81_08300 [Candidatus Cloacimonetes bacterium]|nr:hypothetical protein [Candidatus Cloacimonadota bacterium]
MRSFYISSVVLLALFNLILPCLIQAQINDEELSPSVTYNYSVTSEEEIPSTVFTHFYQELPVDLPVVLDFNTGRFTHQLERLFKEQLINDGYQVFEQVQENSLILRLTYDETILQKSSGFFIFKKHYQEERFEFSYQLTKMPESRILSFENITISSVSSNYESNMRWYDPILISAFIGTLAYLFYFGGN